MPKSMFASRAALLALAICVGTPLAGAAAETAKPGAAAAVKSTAPVQLRGAEEIPEQNKFYDPENPDYQKLQKANESLVGFPLDKKGYVDWMGALRSGFITPRTDLKGGNEMPVIELDVILKNTKEMPWVKFPHKSHTMWLACSNCHDKPFIPKAGANPISMSKIFQGQYCGMCHDRVAFITFFSCERCHSVPQGNAKAWW